MDRLHNTSSKILALLTKVVRDKNVVLVINLFLLPLFGFLWFNFLYQPWPLSWNIAWDFLFTRTGGPILYANHVSSALFILGTASYFAIRNRGHALQWIFVVMAGVSIHELELSVISYPVYAASHPSFLEIVNNPLTLRWVFWLSLIFSIAWVIASPFQRKKLAEMAVVIAIFEFAWTWVGLVYFRIDPMTIIQYSPGPAFFSPIPNLFEVSSWAITGLWWFVPESFNTKRFHELHLHNYLRYLLFYRNLWLGFRFTPHERFLLGRELKGWLHDYIPAGGLEGKTVLDAGAGRGETALFFLKSCGAWKVICIESDPHKFLDLEANAKQGRWNVEIYYRRFELSDLQMKFDYAKIDIEGGEVALLSLDKLPPCTVEIHSRKLVNEFRKKFPQMVIEQRFHWPFRTWVGFVR